jgi:hypothetical protein
LLITYLDKRECEIWRGPLYYTRAEQEMLLREKSRAPIEGERLIGLVGGFDYFFLNFLLKPAKASPSLLKSYSFA